DCFEYGSSSPTCSFSPASSQDLENTAIILIQTLRRKVSRLRTVQHVYISQVTGREWSGGHANEFCGNRRGDGQCRYSIDLLYRCCEIRARKDRRGMVLVGRSARLLRRH